MHHTRKILIVEDDPHLCRNPSANRYCVQRLTWAVFEGASTENKVGSNSWQSQHARGCIMSPCR